MSKFAQITPDDIKGIIVNFPTPVRRDITIGRNTTNVLDLDEAARAADNFIRDGVTGFILNGTFGEYGSLTFEQWCDFTKVVVESVNDRAIVFAGITTLNMSDSIKRGRAAREIGAHGFNVGRPMQSPLNAANIIQWHRDLVEEFPDMAFLLYDDPAAFKGPITDAVYAELAKFPQIVASKGRAAMDLGTQFPNSLGTLVKLLKGRIKILPSEINWDIGYKFNGSDACWSSIFGCAPGAVTRLQDAILSGDHATVEAIKTDIEWANDGGEGLMVQNGFEAFHVNKVATLKKRTDTAGYVRCGPALPPFTHADPERLKTAEACGMRDRELQKKYPHATAELLMAAE